MPYQFYDRKKKFLNSQSLKSILINGAGFAKA